jgi:diaminopimelate epimerase
MTIPFYKYHGTGNDFILLDERENSYNLSTEQIARLCHRRFGIGADGLMKLQPSEKFDFRMIYYNADGREGSMCGNGGRCIVRFAYDLGIRREEYHFIATDGPHLASIDLDGTVRLKMTDVKGLKHTNDGDVLNTGSPPLVKMVTDIKAFPVVAEGREIRYNDEYAAEGINVNFVEVLDESTLYVRTYERGVEDETYSCGTGVTASALANAHNDRGFNHVDIQTLGGNLFVEFEHVSDHEFRDVWLAGPAVSVYKGFVEMN